jgi:hypothetical protein
MAACSAAAAWREVPRQAMPDSSASAAGVERTAHREQLACRVQELVEQRVGGRGVTCPAVPAALRAHPDSLSDLDM